MDFDRLIVGVGYLGSRLARRWQRQGLRVAGTTRSAERLDELASLGVTGVRWNVLGDDAVSEPLPSADVIVYCVGFDRARATAEGHSMRDVYVDGLVRTLRRVPEIGKLVYISSTGVYGSPSDPDEWVDETTPAAPLDPSGEVCLAAEAALRTIAAERQFPFVILRLAGIYGPGRMIGESVLRSGQPVPSDPDAWVNLIEGEDAALVTEAACTHGVSGEIYNVSDGQPVVRGDFYRYLARLLDAPEPTFDPTAARRHRGSRKISARKMMSDLAVTLASPDYRAGLHRALASKDESEGAS